VLNNHIEINNKEDKDIFITQIEYIIEYFKNEDDNMEKELEERYKNKIDNLKMYSHNFKLLDKCITTMKTKMKNKNVIILIIFIFVSHK
jgi:hypothetical protein